MAWLALPAAAAALVASAYLLYESTPAGRRARFIRILLAEVGKSDGQVYWTEVLGRPRNPPTDWCGAFVLWGIRRAFGVTWLWVDGKGFLDHLPQTNDPQPGDIGYAPAYNHHDVILAVNKQTGMITSVDGNSWMGKVQVRTDRHRSYWSNFYSIEPLLRAKSR